MENVKKSLETKKDDTLKDERILLNIEKLKAYIELKNYKMAINTILNILYDILMKRKELSDLYLFFMFTWSILDEWKGEEYMLIDDELRYILYYIIFDVDYDINYQNLLRHIDNLKNAINKLLKEKKKQR